MRRLSLTIAILLTFTATVHADEAAQKKRSKELWNAGANSYDLGNFDEAIVQFKAAFEAYPYPAIEFNLCQAYRQKKDYTQAIWHCKAYLRNEESASNKDSVETLIQDMEKLKKEQEEAAKKPPNQIGRPGTGPSETPRDMWYQDPWGWSFLGAGVVALGVSGGLMLSASSLERDSNLASGEMNDIEFDNDAASRRTTGAVLAAGGAALVVTGVILLALPPSHDTPVKKKKNGAKVAVGVGWLGVEGTF